MARVHRRGRGVPGTGTSGARTSRAPDRPTEALSRREREVLRLAADGRTNDEIADCVDAQRPDGRAPPVERLREAGSDRPGGARGRRRGVPAAPARLRSTPRRRACRPPSTGRSPRRRLGAGALPPRRVRRLRSPQAARAGGTRAEVTHMSATALAETETRFRSRPVRGAIDTDGDGDSGQRARAPVGRPVQLGRRPAGRPRRREPRSEPDGVPAGRPRRVRRGVHPRHARAAVRRRRSTTSQRSRAAPPTHGACSGSTAPSPDLDGHRARDPGHVRRRRTIASRRCSRRGASDARSTSLSSSRSPSRSRPRRDADDARARAVALARGGLAARQRVQGGRRDALATPKVEAVARRQRVEHDAADHERTVAVDLPGVGLGLASRRRP